MAWMHTVCVGPDLAEAKVYVWLTAPLDRTGHPFPFACGDTRRCARAHGDKMASALQ